MASQVAKVFRSGNSQAIRLPNEFRFETDQVYIRREGDAIILTPKPTTWEGFMDGCGPLSEDFSVEGSSLPEDIERIAL